MKDDQRVTALLDECVLELDTRVDASRPRALELLRQVETISPGLIEQMAASLQLARLPGNTAY